MGYTSSNQHWHFSPLKAMVAKGDADISFWKRLIFKAELLVLGRGKRSKLTGSWIQTPWNQHVSLEVTLLGLGSGMKSFTSNFNIACCLFKLKEGFPIQVANSSLWWLTWEDLNKPGFVKIPMDLAVVPVSALKSSRNSESHHEFPRNLRRSKGKRSSSLAFCRSMALGRSKLLKFTI